jgi:hypothetical protein
VSSNYDCIKEALIEQKFYPAIVSPIVLANWLGITPEAVLMNRQRKRWPEEVFLQISGRSVGIDVQVLLDFLREKNRKPANV